VTTVEVETVVDRSVTQALETMLLIRTFEEKSAELQAAGKSPSMCRLSKILIFVLIWQRSWPVHWHRRLRRSCVLEWPFEQHT